VGYEQDFLTARKAYLHKIKDSKPSETLLDVIDEEKPKVLAKKLDQVKGKKFSEMNTAVNMFESYRIAYIKKIGVQIAKETNASKLKSTLNPYGDALGDIVNAYEEECEKQRRAEMPPPPPPLPKAKVAEGKAVGGNAVALAAVKIMLGKVSDGYRKRRQKQLEVAIEVEKDCIERRKQIDAVVDTLQKEVKQAVIYSRGGQVREGEGLKIAAQGQVTKIRAILIAVKKNYHDSLEPFQKERNLKAEEIARSLHIDLPDAHEKELAKIPQLHAKVLTTANAHATAAGRVIEECEHLAGSAENLYSQIADIVEGKDFGKLFLDGAVKMGTRVKTMLDKAIAEAEKLQNIMIPGLTKAVKVLEDKAPPDRISGAQAYVNTNTRMVEIAMRECTQTRTAAGSLIEAEKSKIPPEILKGPAGKVIQQSEALLNRLVTLNAGNAKTATPVLANAEKLVK
jgi:hypothetical protein